MISLVIGPHINLIRIKLWATVALILYWHPVTHTETFCSIRKYWFVRTVCRIIPLDDFTCENFYLFYLYKAKKIILFFPEMRVTRKILTRAAAYLFLLINFPEIFSFFLSFFFAYFGLCFSCWCCWFVVFFKLKLYILIHIRLSGRVSDKIIFIRPISGNKATFFCPNLLFLLIFFPERGGSCKPENGNPWISD